MRRVNMETSVGLFLLAGILCLAYLSVRLGKLELVGGDTVLVTAGFSSVTGLRAGTDVEIAGVPVGKVASISIREHQAIVMMQINNGIALPDDTIASVRTRGLIGDVYISLSPGGSDRVIPPGGRIRETEAAVDLGGLIGQFIHGSAKE
ncbi:MAG: outer membrane lipid asymmetry maintenance protein MlaD [Candidatus Deferrimicrobiaceae bacterium]